MKNAKKKNLLIVTGTRAEYGLFRSTIFALKKSKKLNIKLLVTGMHTLKKFGYTAKEIQKDMPIDCLVPVAESDDMLSSLAKEIVGIKRCLKKYPADALVAIGDRDEPFAAAIVGIHSHIPVIHVSGGDVSGPTVDHYLRNSITVFSKLHLVQTQKSKKNVITLGADKKNTHIVGSAGLDGISPHTLLAREKIAHILGLDTRKKWYLVVLHPTPFEKTPLRGQIYPVLSAAQKLSKNNQVVVIYPNSDTGFEIFIEAVESLRGRKNYFILKNLERRHYLSILYHCHALIGNTSSGLMEAGYLKKPFVLVGNRQKNRERGANTVLVPYNTSKILLALKRVESHSFRKTLQKTPPVYQGGKVADRIVKIIEKFTT